MWLEQMIINRVSELLSIQLYRALSTFEEADEWQREFQMLEEVALVTQSL